MSHAARGSPSRGWPTEPGFSSHSPSADVQLVAVAARLAGRDVALRAHERQRDVRVADERDALALDVEAQLGEQRAEHVLPDRVARARVVEADAGLLAGRRQRAQELEVRRADRLLRPARGERRARRELVEADLAGDAEVVVAGQADRRVPARQLDAGVRLGAVADEVAEAPHLVGARGFGVGEHRLEGVAVAVDVGEDRDLHLVQFDRGPGTPSLVSGDRGRRGGRGGGGGAPATAGRRDRARSGSRRIVLQRLGDRARARLPAPAARALRRRRSLVAARRPGAARRRARRGALRGPFRRPLLAAAAAGAALSVDVSIAVLPLKVVGRERAKRRRPRHAVLERLRPRHRGLVGHRRRHRRRRRGGRARRSSAGSRAAGGSPGSAVVVAFGVVTIYAGPVVLDPLFNTFKALPGGPGALRRARARRARPASTSGEVYEIDASRRTTAANAYVTGLGHTKRVVLYDTLLENFSRDELRLVVAHELGHVHYDDVPNGPAVPRDRRAVRDARGRAADRPPGARGTRRPARDAAGARAQRHVMTTTITTISNQLSRAIEARADAFALQSTSEPEPFISFEQRITLRNLSDPDPPDWITFLLATHPPAIERIGHRRRAAQRAQDGAP